jgi:hypothetical protein
MRTGKFLFGHAKDDLGETRGPSTMLLGPIAVFVRHHSKVVELRVTIAAQKHSQLRKITAGALGGHRTV